MARKTGPDADLIDRELVEMVDEIFIQLEKYRVGESELSSPGKTRTGPIIARKSPALAKATAHVMDRAKSGGLQLLHERELHSIQALFAWVANEQGAAPETVRSMTEVRFGVNDVTKLQQKDYDEVIRFLVDLRIDEMRH
jgi:hypothetical protein